jgi:hypothetical protein
MAKIDDLIKAKYTRMKRSAEKKKVEVCSLDEFLKFSKENKEFMKLLRNWIKSGLERDKTPSISRIDINGNYQIDNLYYVELCKNSAIGKFDYDNGVKTKLIKFGKELSFSSKRKAARYLDVKESELRYALKKKKQIKGWKIILAEKNNP